MNLVESDDELWLEEHQTIDPRIKKARRSK
uniref:Uncharacterized protein n=1 Tax=Ditylenchus dipsaci TaxID=166011 RepID=A0A915D365_9BILA